MRKVEISTYDKENYIVTEQEAEAVTQAMVDERSHVTFSRLKTTVAISHIKLMEPVDVAEERPLLGPGSSQGAKPVGIGQPEPGRDPNSVSVRSQWVKKRITAKQWDKDYANCPGYWRLHSNGSDVWIGFQRVVIRGEMLPEDIEVCDDLEWDKLEKIYTRDY